jgi:hypothetical protein
MPVLTERIERLNRISERRVIDPDAELPGSVGDGQLVPDELLSTHGLDIELSVEQKRVLSREETASILDAGIRFEAVLEAGFALQVTRARELTDPRITYLLHEMGEETRHQRMFQRILGQIAPKATNPLLGHPVLDWLDRFGTGWVTRHPALLYVLVLAGEEIPDLLQKRAAEHLETDPFLAEVNRYHRQEEARHLSFARAILPEIWSEATRVERFVIRRIAAFAIKQMFSLMVHPGVYAEIGLEPWPTWKQVNRTRERIELRRTATRPVLTTMIDAGVFGPGPGRVPKGWRELCGVDRRNEPVRSV